MRSDIRSPYCVGGAFDRDSGMTTAALEADESPQHLKQVSRVDMPNHGKYIREHAWISLDWL